MNWDLGRWQGLDVELCLSPVHIREGEEITSPSGALVCLRTHLVPNELEQCPTSNYKGYSLQVRTECSEPPTPHLNHVFKHTHPYHLSYCGRRKRHDTRNWKKSHFSSRALFGKPPNSRTFPKGLFELALGALLGSLQRQHKGYNRD